MEEKNEMKATYVKRLLINVESIPLDDGEEIAPASLLVCQASWPDAQKQLHPVACVTHPMALAGLIARGIDAYFDHPSLSGL